MTAPKFANERFTLFSGSVLPTAAAIGLILTVLLLFVNLPVTYHDWIRYLRPAAEEWNTPFRSGIFNPPWLFLILHPLTVLTPRLGAGLLMLISTVVVARYVGTPMKTLVVACSAPMVVLFTLGQIDALPVLGLMVPSSAGLPLLLMKPQGVYLTIIPRINRRSVTVMLLVIIVSVLVWGFWWLQIGRHQGLLAAPHNVSLFPYSAVLGLPALYYGLRRDSDALLCLASLCLSPYYMITSGVPAVAAIVRETEDRRLWTITVLGSWLYLLIMRRSVGAW